MNRIIFLAAGLIFLICSFSFAEDYNFETTSEGIVGKLSGSKKGSKTRSIKKEIWTDAFGSDARPVKTRSIKIVRKDRDKEVWETVITPEQRTCNYVNLRVEFDVDSYAIQPEYFFILNELGKALNDPRLKGRIMYVNGHTDSDGAATYNLRLSMNRALAVKLYLISNHSISPDRLVVYGYGESMPLRSNTSAANKQLNRRVEIVAFYPLHSEAASGP